MVYSAVAGEFLVYYLLLSNCIVLDERWVVVLSKVMPNSTKSTNKQLILEIEKKS
jgi:hypothetical protein